jgi:hypothetical protein
VELEEAKKIEDVLKQQLSEKKFRCEALEEEIVKTRKEMEKFKGLYHQNLPSIKASEGLTSILNQQRNSKLKARLGYEEGSSSDHPSNTESIKFVKSSNIDNSHSAETKKENQPPRRNERKSTRTKFVDQKDYWHERNQPPQRRQIFSRYTDFFYGYCFFCSNFGHKAINCSLRFRYEQSRYSMNNYLPQQRLRQPSNKQSQTINHVMTGRRTQVKHNNNYEHNNRYDLLFSEPECYNCHNYGHKATNCHLMKYNPDLIPTTENVKVWKKKADDKCGLVLSAQKQKNPWYIDSGCSKHMTGDKSKFLTLSENKSGNVTFGNDAPGKIKGKGMVSLSNGKGKAQDVLFVDGMKHNLLSVIQVCDKGCEVVFTSKDCKIKALSSGQLIAKGIRIENNVYVLKEEKEECHLSKYDESWLWHRRLGHLNFDHIIKLRNNGAVKDLPKISKPYDYVCKSCQIGKLTCTQFKSKKIPSTEKPLQLVHMDLCGPSRKEGTGKEKLVDCIDIKVDEEIPVRNVSSAEPKTKDIVEDEDEQVQGSEKEESESDEDTNTQTDTNQQKEAKSPLRIIRKNHPENQIIGDINKGV